MKGWTRWGRTTRGGAVPAQVLQEAKTALRWDQASWQTR
ncbi:hypothetical protein YSA_11279 [Pseudomonas putida ND6]|uniref:Uncharacterized protein n=1 Tax=Pseudomonas putida ND6 TaxID=231023 RepID=I3V570_PSEPU|nr:hypothetical protein YSA_11279 [Pseudomonas putida ND6]